MSLKTKAVRENKAKMENIRRDLANIGSGTAVLEGLEQQLSSSVSVGGRGATAQHCCEEVGVEQQLSRDVNEGGRGGGRGATVQR